MKPEFKPCSFREQFVLPLSLLLGLLGPGLAFGAENADDLIFSLPLQELLKIKITSATKHEETLYTVPSAVTIIGENEIRRMGVDNLAELMNFVPGYQSYRTDRESLGQIASSRGSRVGYASRELLILMDGVRLNDDYNGGAFSSLPVIGLENVERVEFIRGPGSALYGSNAFMGVVNIITKGNRSLAVETGSHRTHKLALQHYWRGEDSEIDLYARARRSDGESLVVYDPDPSAQDYRNTHDPYHDESLYLSIKKGELSARLQLNQYNAEEFYVFGFVSDDDNEWDQHRYSLSLGHDTDISPMLKMSMALQLTSSESNYVFIADQQSALGYDSTAKEQGLGANFSLLYDDQGGTNAVLGFEFRQPDFESRVCYFGVRSDCLDLVERSERSIRGVYGQYQRQFTADLRGIIGARYDNYSDFGDHVSPRLGLIYQLGDRNTLKLLYGEAFRAPSRTESSLINNAVYIGNPDLKPEVAKTTEIIFMRLLNSGYFQLTLFDVRIEDAIQDSDMPPPKQVVNAGDDGIGGIELDYQYQLSDQWSLRAAVTHIANKPEDPSTESDTLLGFSVNCLAGPWTATLNANYQGQKYNHYSPDLNAKEYIQLGGHTLFSAYTAYRYSPAVELYLKLDNVFDKHYRVPAERSVNNVGVVGRGRYLLAGVRWDY